MNLRSMDEMVEKAVGEMLKLATLTGAYTQDAAFRSLKKVGASDMEAAALSRWVRNKGNHRLGFRRTR